MAKWIKFEPFLHVEGRKTVIWRVISTSDIGVLLGDIRWYGRWRRYCFFPNNDLALVFEQDCLRDIAQFCEDQTKLHRQKPKAGD
jgi:hypothetical protein